MSNKKEKRNRNAISLETKILILDRLKAGERYASLGRHFKFGESTIRAIKKNEAAIRASVISGTELNAKKASYSRGTTKERLEKMLLIWLEDLNQKRIPTNGQLIKERALRLYEQLKNSEPTTSSDNNIAEFSASTGWLTGFLKRNAFHNVKITGEIASADEEGAKSFPKKLLKIIEDGGYSPDQVFNADETGLFWKKMPSRTYIAKSEKSASGFKAAKDRVTFLFCSNASGDRILKPLVVNRSLKPRSLKGKDMEKLPVHWMANKKAWVTTAIFTEWFNRYFVPEVKKYLLDKGLEFKVILLIDNAPGHPHIEHANVEIVFLPPNTTSILQPLDQGIICNFKKHYVKLTFQHILDKIENEEITVTDAWKKFSLLDCINHAGLAVKAIKPQTLNTCWKTVWPECDQRGSLSEEISISEIISLGHEIGGEGFQTLCNEDIDELLLDPALNDEDLMEIIAGDSGKDIESEDEITPFTSNVNRKGIQMCSELENYYLTNDPDTERALKFQRELNLCMSTYRELYKQESKPAKQKLITDYIRNANPTSMEPPASPSRSDVYISSSDESDFTPNPKRMRNMRVLSDSISDDVNLFFDSDVS